MGFLKTSQPTVEEEPEEVPLDDGLADADALDRASQRARDASSRINRKKLRIPLGTDTSTGSGLAIQ